MNSSSEMCDTSFSITTATHSFRRTSLYVAEEDLQPNPHLDCFREVVVLSFSSPLSKCICRRSAADLNARIVPTQLTCAYFSEGQPTRQRDRNGHRFMKSTTTYPSLRCDITCTSHAAQLIAEQRHYAGLSLMRKPLTIRVTPQ